MMFSLFIVLLVSNTINAESSSTLTQQLESDGIQPQSPISSTQSLTQFPSLESQQRSPLLETERSQLNPPSQIPHFDGLTPIRAQQTSQFSPQLTNVQQFQQPISQSISSIRTSILPVNQPILSQTIPQDLLTITRIGSQSLPQLSQIESTSLLSPAQQLRKVQERQEISGVVPERGTLTEAQQFDTSLRSNNLIRDNSAFSTPTKPLTFAPMLPITQTLTQTLPQPILSQPQIPASPQPQLTLPLPQFPVLSQIPNLPQIPILPQTQQNLAQFRDTVIRGPAVQTGVLPPLQTPIISPLNRPVFRPLIGW